MLEVALVLTWVMETYLQLTPLSLILIQTLLLLIQIPLKNVIFLSSERNQLPVLSIHRVKVVNLLLGMICLSISTMKMKRVISKKLKLRLNSSTKCLESTSMMLSKSLYTILNSLLLTKTLSLITTGTLVLPVLLENLLLLKLLKIGNSMLFNLIPNNQLPN